LSESSLPSTEAGSLQIDTWQPIQGERPRQCEAILLRDTVQLVDRALALTLVIGNSNRLENLGAIEGLIRQKEEVSGSDILFACRYDALYWRLGLWQCHRGANGGAETEDNVNEAVELHGCGGGGDV
jgi:hypothetical protein